MDIAFATAGLLGFAPSIMIIALAIWMDSGRPIFFSQARLGEAGRHFQIYKFRKFRNDCDDGYGVTIKDDRRLTRMGRFLVATKLDELPQLWNLLRGDMSMVGPRPESLKFADCFANYREVLDYKPGIFGPNQYYFRDESLFYPDGSDPEQFYRDVLFPLKAEIDLAYFPERTIGADLGWIARGILAVFGLRLAPTKFNAVLARWLS